MTGFGFYITGFMAAAFMAVLNAPFGKFSWGRRFNTVMLCVLSWIGAAVLTIILIVRFLRWMSGDSR